MLSRRLGRAIGAVGFPGVLARPRRSAARATASLDAFAEYDPPSVHASRDPGLPRGLRRPSVRRADRSAPGWGAAAPRALALAGGRNSVWPMTAFLNWWDGNELWLSGLPFVLQAVVMMPIVLAVAYLIALVLDGLLGKGIDVMRRLRRTGGTPR